MKELNDNETFQTLGLHALRLIDRLQKMDGPQEGPTRKPEPTKSEKEVANPEHGNAYIDAGLKRIRDFERRYRSGK